MSVGGGFLTDILGPSLLAGAGLGFAFVTSTIAGVSGVEDREQGIASGLINTAQQIGGALGLAVLSTLASTRTDHVIATGASSLPNALTEGFQIAFLGGAMIAALGVVATLVLIRTLTARRTSRCRTNRRLPPQPRNEPARGLRVARPVLSRHVRCQPTRSVAPAVPARAAVAAQAGAAT